jgi:hypothetical protein
LPFIASEIGSLEYFVVREPVLTVVMAGASVIKFLEAAEAYPGDPDGVKQGFADNRLGALGRWEDGCHSDRIQLTFMVVIRYGRHPIYINALPQILRWAFWR